MTEPKPKVSCVIPFHWMENWSFFLTRCLKSIEEQSFTDYEIVVMKVGSMPVTSNAVIKACKGEIIKVLYMDDYLAHQNSLKNIVNAFTGGWLVTGCEHDTGDGFRRNQHFPEWNDEVPKGTNTIGSPSVLAFANEEPLLFDERLSWLLDCELYGRLYKRYGMPTILNDINVVIGLHSGQMTQKLTREEKEAEGVYLLQKYG